MIDELNTTSYYLASIRINVDNYRPCSIALEALNLNELRCAPAT